LSRPFPFARSEIRRRNPRAADTLSPETLASALDGRRLRSLPPALEEQFQQDTREDQIRALFRAALATAAVYNVQLIAEYSLTPDAFGFAAALHFGVVTPALLLIAANAHCAAAPLCRDLMGLAIPALVAGQVALTFFASAAPGAAAYPTLFAMIAILGNASLPLSARASAWSTAFCLVLLAVTERAAQHGAGKADVGVLVPMTLCMAMTLISAAQRNREARRAYLLDQRQRLRMLEVGLEARHDALTGLANRRRLEEAARKLWAEDSALVSPVAVVLFDVDRFKAFNDLYGHQAGDECLKKVAACALAEIGAGDDVAARYGGEEFIIVLPRTALDEARRVAERLRAAVAALRIDHSGSEELGVVTASFGVACADSSRRSFEELTADADSALYRAKRAGRNRVLAAAPNSPRGPKAA
jgi:diguanylate cyclase (GGDEF)-like protein